MGWSNPPVPWAEFERALSDKPRPAGADGGDAPGWSRKRERYEPHPIAPPSEAVVPYAELHVHSNYSFLDGASRPEDLLEEATRLGLHGIALTDHDGFYGVVRLAEAAESYPIATIFGAELSLDLPAPQNGATDPAGSHLLVLARGTSGYNSLSGAITAAQLQGKEKGRPIYDLAELSERSNNEWLVLSGCRKGQVRRALVAEGEQGAARELRRLVELFGRDNVAVELTDHGNPLDSSQNDALAAVAHQLGLPTVATGNVHFATPRQHRLASALSGVRARSSLDFLDGWLPASGAAYLRSGAEMTRRFARYPGAVARTVEFSDQLAFSLRAAKPELPLMDVPAGHTPMTYLRQLVKEGISVRYPNVTEKHLARIEKELAVIEEKEFPGYFLIVHDIVRFARSRGILCQGRGSAANSAVCYLLMVTAVDPIKYKLPFERFLSAIRDEEPDIDIDFDSDRREEVIQYVYAKYGRENAAQVANVITYRPKNAVRDMARALGYSPGQQDAWSRQVERHGENFGKGDEEGMPPAVVGLAQQVMGFPRHLGIHSGGMVLTKESIGTVVPIENARMENRTVVQWDKDDCAWMGLVKFDLLGLGMLSALQHAFDLVAEHVGERWELATIPAEEPGVYDMLCRADAIGLFQVESRAQMGLLPRLQPREFYDLVIQIALVRPGPIQGGAVHPFVRRKMGQETETYVHEKLREPLGRTRGIPIFQEQLMQMAVAIGNCTPEDAEQLRRAMGSKRGRERIGRLRDTLYAGMAANGLSREESDGIYNKIEAFAEFGFAESHSLSFSLLVYASAWLKLHYPGAFLAALLRSQPMGFYSPQSLIADARRHGVETLRPDLLHSGATAGLELLEGRAGTATGTDACLPYDQPKPGLFDPAAPFDTATHRRDAAFAVRLGLDTVKGIGGDLATKIVTERENGGDYRDMRDLVRRVGLTTAQLESLAAADAFGCFGLSRREALWSAGSAAKDRAEYLPDSMVTTQPPLFAMPTELDTLLSDTWATGLSAEDHILRHLRPALDSRGVFTASALKKAESGRRIEVAGIVTHRQRPATASGITFINLEDETGLVNVICSVGVWSRYRRIARESPALIVRGILERSAEGVTNLLADRLEPLGVATGNVSRDFR